MRSAWSRRGSCSGWNGCAGSRGRLSSSFLIAVFPANAYAAEHPEKFGRAAFPFWPRYLAQLGLIVLVTLAAAPVIA